MRYRKKPIVIDAIQYTGKNSNEVVSFMAPVKNYEKQFVDDFLYINTLEGEMRASVGDWIIKGVKGEFYPCKPDIFEATYEPEQSQADNGGCGE